MQARYLDSQQKVSNLLQDAQFHPDLLVISLDSADVYHHQAKCPNFCYAAAAQGKTVAVINFDLAYQHKTNRLYHSTHKNLAIYYTGVPYNNSAKDKKYTCYQAEELKDLIIQYLSTKLNSKVVMLYNNSVTMPRAYKELALVDNFVEFYKDRLFFLSQIYSTGYGFVYNQAYIAKLAIYERSYVVKQKLALEPSKPDYTDLLANFNRIINAYIDNMASNAYPEAKVRLGYHYLTRNDKPLNDAASNAYLSLCAEADVTLGYPYLALEDLALDVVLQSEFKPEDLLNQHVEEIIKFNQEVIYRYDPEKLAKKQHAAIDDYADGCNNSELQATLKKTLALVLNAPKAEHRQQAIALTYDLLITGKCSPDFYAGYMPTKLGKQKYTLFHPQLIELAWQLADMVQQRQSANLKPASNKL